MIALVRDRDLKSPELTGQWEAKLRQIESGQLEPETFMEAVEEYTAQIIRSGEAAIVTGGAGATVLCYHHQVIQGNRGYGCSAWKEGCKFVLWPTYKDYELDAGQIRQLLQHGVLQQPIELASVGRVILSMSDSGAVTDIPLPEREPHRGNVKRKRADSTRRTEQPAGGVDVREPDVGSAWRVRELPFVWSRSPGAGRILQVAAVGSRDASL